MRLPLYLLTTAFILLLSRHSYGMWAGMSDAELIKSSSIIIKATYIGDSTINLHKKGYRLGVLKIEDTLKGKEQNTLFIQLPIQTRFPQGSDSIRFNAGQKGIWFLEKNTAIEGVYKINNPQRFIPEQQFKNRLPALFKLLN